MVDESGGEQLEIKAAAEIAGRSAETVRRWVWSGRLRAHKRGNRLLIARSDLQALLARAGTGAPLSLAEWVEAAAASPSKRGVRAESAADLVLEDRRARPR